MKKITMLLAAAFMAGALLTGCASQQKSAFSPAVSCVYVAQDGKLSSALVKEYEGEAVNEKDLKQYLEAAIIRFNQQNGAEGAAANKQGGDRLPVALQSVKADKERMTAIFDYASADTMRAFRQTDDNADISNTITALEVKKAAEADTAGWLTESTFVKADKSSASADDIKADAENMVVLLEGGATVMFSGKILYVTEGTEITDEYTVTVPDGGKAFVVFK